MIIKITEQDIEAGKRNDCEKCPIALALNRAFENPKGFTISVCEDFVELFAVGDSEGNLYFNLPANAQEFVFDFDNMEENERPEPFSFRLDKNTVNYLTKNGIKINAAE